MALGIAEIVVILIVLILGVGGLVVTIFGLVRSAQRSEWGWFAGIIVGLVLGVIGEELLLDSLREHVLAAGTRHNARWAVNNA